MTPDSIPTNLSNLLLEADETGRTVRVGLVGCGEMGTDIVTRCMMMRGVRVAAIVDNNPARGINAINMAHPDADAGMQVASTDDLNATIENGRTAVTGNVHHMLNSGLIDVIVDATGVPAAGAEIGLASIEHGKHLVMMNVEADVTIGRYLKRAAAKQGVIYSLGAGDEPSSCMELIEFATAMGHRIVAAGKGKNNPLDFDAIPDDYEEEARQRNMSTRMLVEFVDGSKSMVEMAAIANATGLVPDIPGMHRPTIAPHELASTFIPSSDGGILSDAGRVDFTTGGGLAPGVFIVIHAEHPRILERLRDLKVGDGPYFSFVRPYHLTSLEVPLTCARAVLQNKSDMQPLDHPVTEVCAIAKRDIKPGETLGLIGQYHYRSWTMTHQDATSANAVPCGLLANALCHQPIPKGSLITHDHISLPDNALVKMRRELDAI